MSPQQVTGRNLRPANLFLCRPAVEDLNFKLQAAKCDHFDVTDCHIYP
jgi:hypothetical protein